jgi:hypothetical protein
MKHKQTMTINFRNSYGSDEYILSQYDMTQYGTGWVKVGEVEVEYESPDDFNPVAAQIEALQKQKHELVRQFTQKIEEIKEQISKLEALEYSGEAA